MAPGAPDESGKLVPLDLQAGDRVLFGKCCGTEVTIDSQDLAAVRLLLALKAAHDDAVAQRTETHWGSFPVRFRWGEAKCLEAPSSSFLRFESFHAALSSL